MHKQSIMTRAVREIKGYKRKLLMMRGLLKSRSETVRAFSTVLVKEMQRFRKKHCDGGINRQRREKDSAALEGGTGRLTQREEQKCFCLPAPSFPHLPSSSISISLHIQFFFSPSYVLSAIVLYVKSCHDKAGYFLCLTLRPVQLP